MRWLTRVLFATDSPAGATPPPPAAATPSPTTPPPAAAAPPGAQPPAATPPASQALPAEFLERLSKSDNGRFRAEQEAKQYKAEAEAKTKALEELERTIQTDPEAALAKYNKTIEDILDRRAGGGKAGPSEEVRSLQETVQKLAAELGELKQGKQADTEAQYLGRYASQVAPALEADPILKAGLSVASGFGGMDAQALLAAEAKSQIAAYHQETGGQLLTPSQASDRIGIGLRAKREALMKQPGFLDDLCTFFDLTRKPAASPAPAAPTPGAPPAAAPAPTLQPGISPPGAGAPVDLAALSHEERLEELKRRHGIK